MLNLKSHSLLVRFIVARAVLRAAPWLEGHILNGNTMPIAFPVTVIERISFVGRKSYGHNRFNLTDPDNCGGIGSSVTLIGLYHVTDVESSFAVCGTAFSIEGAFILESSYIHDNGWDTNSSWADGITLQGCTPFGAYAGIVRGNLVDNSTDIGIVTGGGPCQVYANEINQTNIHAFAGLWSAGFPAAPATMRAQTITTTRLRHSKIARRLD